MLAKILFTAAVIIGVVLFFRGKRQPREATEPDTTPSLSPRALAYGLLALLLGASALIAFIDA